MSPSRPSRLNRTSKLVAASLVATLAIGGGAWLALGLASFAQDGHAREAEKSSKPGKPAERPDAAADAAPRPAPPSAARAAPARQSDGAAAPASNPDFAARLRQNGVGTCAAQVDAMAATTMAAVKRYDTASGWAVAGGDKRVVTLSIGQRYADGSAVPFSAASVLAAPDGRGSCDAVAVQVVPSPLSCAKLRDAMAARGRQIGDLAGVPLMQDSSGQTMLVPTAADTCVLVGMQTAYAQ